MLLLVENNMEISGVAFGDKIERVIGVNNNNYKYDNKLIIS